MTDILVDAAIEECRDRMARAVEHADATEPAVIASTAITSATVRAR